VAICRARPSCTDRTVLHQAFIGEATEQDFDGTLGLIRRMLGVSGCWKDLERGRIDAYVCARVPR
jgi:hypothetical protein